MHWSTGPSRGRCTVRLSDPATIRCRLRCRCVALCAGCSVLQLVVESYICKLVVSGLCWPGTPRHTTTGCHLHNGQLRSWPALAFAAQPVRRDGPHWVTKHLHINSHLISAGFLQLSHAHPLLAGSDSSRCAILYS